MAYESSVRIGSGISALREGFVAGQPALQGMRGTNVVLINYEDLNSKLGISQASGLAVSSGLAIQLTGPENRLGGRRQMIVQNLGNAPAYIGPSGVTTDTGLQIGVNNRLSLEVMDVGDLFIVSAGNSDIRILELK